MTKRALENHLPLPILAKTAVMHQEGGGREQGRGEARRRKRARLIQETGLQWRQWGLKETGWLGWFGAWKGLHAGRGRKVGRRPGELGEGPRGDATAQARGLVR